jgi:hypothetical protein
MERKKALDYRSAIRQAQLLVGRQIRESVLPGPHCLTAFGPTKHTGPVGRGGAKTDYTAVKNNLLLRKRKSNSGANPYAMICFVRRVTSTCFAGLSGAGANWDGLSGWACFDFRRRQIQALDHWNPLAPSIQSWLSRSLRRCIKPRRIGSARKLLRTQFSELREAPEASLQGPLSVRPQTIHIDLLSPEIR